MTVGEALREIRLTKGVSAKALSLKLGLHKSYISRVEKGEITPTKQKLIQIYENLGLPIELISIVIADEQDIQDDTKREFFNLVKPFITELIVTFATSKNSKLIEESNTVLIMKGGGIKGLAYIGALEELEHYYKFNWYAGTSAGAISAILLASGYSTNDLKDILFEKNFSDFRDANILSALFNLFIHGGLYHAHSFTEWLTSLLATKLNSPVEVLLKDLPHRATVYASRRNKKALIFDSKNQQTHEKNAAFCARCSMSIPLLFIPQRDEGMRILDGGMQNNYPVSLILEEEPDAKYVGLYLGNPVYQAQTNTNIFSDIYSIWSEGNDIHSLREFAENTIVIDPEPISTLNFTLSKAEKEYLLQSGRFYTRRFLKKIGKLKISDTVLKQEENALLISKISITKKRRYKKVVIGIAILFVVIASCYYRFM